MKIIKKINNNVAIGLDGHGREAIVFGKGIGFEKMPYELKDLSKIDRTYYDIDERYIGMLNEIDEKIFSLVARMCDIAKNRIEDNLNPNLVFILADHISFAVTRYQKGMNVTLPYSYELEYEYPEITKIAKWFIKNIDEKLKVHLDKGEVTSITMHFINAMEGSNKHNHAKATDKTSRIIRNVTKIVEDYFNMILDKSSFNYFRFKNHLKYFVQRKERNEEFTDSNLDLYESMKENYHETYACVSKIEEYLFQEFNEKCTHEELLYLMIHVNRLYTKEDCNRKGITPEK